MHYELCIMNYALYFMSNKSLSFFCHKYWLSILSVFFLVSCGGGSSQQSSTDDADSIATAQRINNDIIHSQSHYWDNVNFADTTISHNSPQLQQAFLQWAEYTHYLYAALDTVASQRVIIQAQQHPHAVVALMEMASQLFVDPNSPLRCEEIYIAMLQEALKAPIDDTHKALYKGQLDIAMMNRKGTQATDINYITEDGITGSLYNISAPYTLLYFFNPDCHDCERVTSVIATNQRINTLINADSLKVVAIYPDKDFTAWNKHIGKNPKSWITAKLSTPAERDKYDLPAIPNLYLLDSNKKVLLKDAPIEQIISFF